MGRVAIAALPYSNREENIMQKDKIVFELVTTNVMKQWPCNVCGGYTEDVPILAEVSDGQHKGLRICETCIENGNHDKMLFEYAEHLERTAQYTRSLIGRLVVPSIDEYRKAENQWNKEADEGIF